MISFAEFFDDCLLNEALEMPKKTRIWRGTLEQLKKLAKNKRAVENDFLWTLDGKDEEELSDIVDDLEDEDISNIKITATGLSEKGEQDFADGFQSVSADWFDTDADEESSDPWCAPWTSQKKSAYFDGSKSAYDMGKLWWKKNEKELKRLSEGCCSDDEDVDEDYSSLPGTRELFITKFDVASQLAKSPNNQFIWQDRFGNYYDPMRGGYVVKGKDKLRIQPCGLSSLGKKEFIRGFIDGAPVGYDNERDLKQERPWCKPWLNPKHKDFNYWYPDDAYESGKKYAKRMHMVMRDF